MCLGSSCCKEEDETRKKKKEATSLRTSRASPGGGGVWGECMMHAQTCGGGCGVFFVVQQSMVRSLLHLRLFGLHVSTVSPSAGHGG